MDSSHRLPDSSGECIRHLSATVTKQSCVLRTLRGKTRDAVSKCPDAMLGVCQVPLQTAGWCASMPDNVNISWAHPGNKVIIT